jgi:hypothetical protein
MKVDHALDGFLRRSCRLVRDAQDADMDAMQGGLPVDIAVARCDGFGKLDVPLIVLAVRQALEHCVLQESQPFRIAIVIGDNLVLVPQISDLVGFHVRMDMEEMAPDRAALERAIVVIAVCAFQQHVRCVMSLCLLKQFSVSVFH